MNEIKLVPIPTKKLELGMYKTDLARIGAKEGDWLGVKFKEKTISAQAREVEKEITFADNLILINKKQREQLGLPDISQNDAYKPPKDLEVTVWKHRFTKSKQLLPAVATFIMLLTGIILKAFSEGGILPKFKIAFDMGLVVLAVISAIITAYGVYTQRQ